jgi:4-hydroxybenzoate polyprenyltransferase
MLVMPFIDLFVTGCDWAAQGATMPSLLWLFLGLSLANGCVLEVGRKTWAPENERAGVETYSMLLGPSASSLLWTLFLFAALALLVRFGFASGFPSMAVPAVLLFGYCAHVGSVFSDEHDSALQKSIDDLSGYWVFTCYASAGFLPFVKVLFA